MRAEDIREIEALGNTVEGAIRHSVDSTPDPWTVLYDGRVIAMFGLAIISILSGLASPWMLSAAELPIQHRHATARLTKQAVDIWKREHPRLINIIDPRYKSGIRWLQWLGFKVHDPEPMGKNMQLMHKVTIGD
jgi:hypothetical protein